LREASRQRILDLLGEDDLVLDIGGWADPFERADWIMDIGQYDTRGLYGRAGWKEAEATPIPERFTRETWVQRDICDREPFPFSDDKFDFVICSHTLEDVRDPVWVCSEISRIGKAGYIETPSRLEEQSWGVTGPYVGRHHHHWMVDSSESGLEFIFKPHNIHSAPKLQFPSEFLESLTEDERVMRFWWEGSFSVRERVLFFEGGDKHLAELVTRELAARNMPRRSDSPLRRRAKRVLRRG
jgi:SAM-dependent methyltransferase